jgi:hypothetical protein
LESETGMAMASVIALPVEESGQVTVINSGFGGHVGYLPSRHDVQS